LAFYLAPGLSHPKPLSPYPLKPNPFPVEQGSPLELVFPFPAERKERESVIVYSF